MCLYCEYVVFDFEFYGFVFDFEFFSFVFNFEFFYLNFEFSGKKKKPRNFFKNKNKTYSHVLNTA